MKYKPEQEMELVEELLTYRFNPRGFVQFCYPWGEEGTPLHAFKEPRKWQIETLEALGDHTINQEIALDGNGELDIYQEGVASGRGIGKSALFGWLTNWQLSTHIGASVVVTANTEGQLRAKTFPEFGVWFTQAINRHWWSMETLKVVPEKWIGELVRDQLKIGTGYWGCFGTPWSAENPDAFAGIHNQYGLSVFFDEASGIPPAIWDVTQGFFTERNAYRHWIAFSQGRRNDGRFYDIFHGEGHQAYWKTRQIDARDVEGADQRVYQQIIDTYGPDSDQARVEVYGQFPEQGEAQFIPASFVHRAERRSLPDISGPVDWEHNLYMGVDPAPRGRTAIRFRCGPDARTIAPVILQGQDNIAIAKRVEFLALKYGVDAVAIDQGMGTGVIDYLKATGFNRRVPLYAVSFGSSATSSPEWAVVGTEIWARMRDWLESEGCIDANRELRRDLISRSWKWFGREDNKKILESKKDLEKRGVPSPDDADALALTFYPNLPPKDERLRRAAHGRIAQGVDNEYGF